MESWTEMYPSHKRINISEFKLEDADILDIAQALSNQCRFRGSCKFHYSIAQHSVYVHDILKRDGKGPYIRFSGLMHDAAEAYIGDVPAPEKQTMEGYQLLEKKIMKIIGVKFNFETGHDPDIDHVDKALCLNEAFALGLDINGWGYLTKHGLISDWLIEKWTPEHARSEFMNRFYQYRSE